MTKINTCWLAFWLESEVVTLPYAIGDKPLLVGKTRPKPSAEKGIGLMEGLVAQSSTLLRILSVHESTSQPY